MADPKIFSTRQNVSNGSPVGLYLIVEAVPGQAALDRLKAALTAAPVASVLIRSHTERALDASGAKHYVEAIQAAGVAALIDGDAKLARTVRADGVHLVTAPDADDETMLAAYTDARETLGARFIVGADAGGTRHGAMALGEAGADYVAFSGPDRSDLVAWWADIFEIPCVAFDVATHAEAATCSGADFVAFGLPAGLTAGDVQERVRAFATAVAGGHRVAAAPAS
jgi:thiamine-phosphate pyrophosphorylase